MSLFMLNKHQQQSAQFTLEQLKIEVHKLMLLYYWIGREHSLLKRATPFYYRFPLSAVFKRLSFNIQCIEELMEKEDLLIEGKYLDKPIVESNQQSYETLESDIDELLYKILNWIPPRATKNLIKHIVEIREILRQIINIHKDFILIFEEDT